MPSIGEWRGYTRLSDIDEQVLDNTNQEDFQYEIRSYKHNFRKELFLNVIFWCMLGIPHLLMAWYPKLKVFKYEKCSFVLAELILISDNHGNHEIAQIETEDIDLSSSGESTYRYFCHKHTKYLFNSSICLFVPLEETVAGVKINDILENSYGVNDYERENLLKLYGPNKIEIEVKSYYKLFVEEVFNPFYLFQVFSILLWSFDDYIIYAGCVLFLTLFSAITALVETRRQSRALYDLVQHSYTNKVQVLQPGDLEPSVVDVEPKNLVPGDLLVIPATGFVVPCDAVLITGNCIVNESMLTGESVPVTKTPPNSERGAEYSSNNHKKHTLFSGTHILQTRYYGGEKVLARVVGTGFNTAKGSLVKSILFPTPVGLQFFKDSLKFVAALFFIAMIGMSYCIYLYVIRGATTESVILRALDIVTIVVPPALPAAMTVGIVYSQNRLKKLGIFCISPPRINICGKLKLACFDKTGTLTHEGLEMYSVVPCVNRQFQNPVIDPTDLDVQSKLLQGMASCHSLTRIEGQLTGDPLDVNMFENTQWDLEEAGQEECNRYDMLAPTVVKPRNYPIFYQQKPRVGDSAEIFVPYEVGILRQFPFSSSQQCMSVIARELGVPHMTVFTKGAPEKIKNLCVSDSLPDDYVLRLSTFTSRGFRVIAIAYKYLSVKFKWKDAQKIKRDVIECDLIFLGFIIMQNTLKPESSSVIRTLHQADIRTVMITGDNIMTAISVARDCGMIHFDEHVALFSVEEESGSDVLAIQCMHHPLELVDFNDRCWHFALDGRSWSFVCEHLPHLLPELILRTTVFARFQPDQKTQLVKELQKIGYVVSMVGDGANDCGALKAAHVGISLSQAEASVAAPFTSAVSNISCVLHLMKEGRCALVTSFAVFKYMALYSLIQFFSVLILYAHHSILGDMQFLFIDLIITTSLAVTIGRQGPFKKLVARRPMGSLFSKTTLIPLLIQIGTCGLVQLGALYYLNKQPWFKPLPPGKEEEVVCWENSVLFTISCFQYIIIALVYSKGRPYRTMLLTNFWLVIIGVGLSAFVGWLFLAPTKEIARFFEMYFVPTHRDAHIFKFKLVVLGISLGHLLIAAFVEIAIADSGWFRSIVHCTKKNPKSRYKVLNKTTDFNVISEFCKINS